MSAALKTATMCVSDPQRSALAALSKLAFSHLPISRDKADIIRSHTVELSRRNDYEKDRPSNSRRLHRCMSLFASLNQ
jgi:hypothetical protein